MLLHQGFQQGFVFQRGLQVGLGFQGLFVGVDRRFQFTGFGQRIASIVVGVGIIAFGKAFDGFSVVTGFVQRHALPLRVLKVFGRFGGTLLLEQVLALLVGAQPQVLPLEGIAGLRRSH